MLSSKLLHCSTKYPLKADSRGSLPLDMLDGCVKTVERAGRSFAQTAGLYTLYTATIKYLTSQVFFMRRLDTAFQQSDLLYTQGLKRLSHLLFSYLYPLSTTSMITNIKLI